MPLVYEINTRCWLRDLSSRADRPITLADVPDSEFQEWQRLGFSHIWLMGVWTSGPRSRAVALAVDDLQKAYGCSLQTVQQTDIVGSPYAIAEYRVPRNLGGDSGLRKFREKLDRHGLKLLLDFVPNHVGLDHSWLKERPDLFVQSATEALGTFAQETDSGLRWIAHGKDPNFAPWSDTAQLDYRRFATRAAMQEQLLEVAEHCDGVRCDMSMLVLKEVFATTWAKFPVLGEIGGAETEFWPDAIAATTELHPEFLFIAEVYWGLEERLQAMGFDFTYNKELYDEIIRGNPAGIQQRLLKAKPEFLDSSVHFLENHDETRIASALSLPEHRAAALLLLTLPGMRLLHEGQLAGARLKSPVQLSCRPAEAVQPEIREFYENVLLAIKHSPVGNGCWRILQPVETNGEGSVAQNVILILWQGDVPVFYLTAINLGADRRQCRAILPPDLRFGPGWIIQNALASHDKMNSVLVTESSALFLDLAAHESRFLRLTPPQH